MCSVQYAPVRGGSSTSNLIEPSRTSSSTEIATYINFFHTSSGWFDCTELSPTTSLQGIQGVQGAICTSSEVQAHRTFSNYILTEVARYIEFFYTSLGWFDCTKPSLTTSLQGIQGVQGTICTSWHCNKICISICGI